MCAHSGCACWRTCSAEQLACRRRCVTAAASPQETAKECWDPQPQARLHLWCVRVGEGMMSMCSSGARKRESAGPAEVVVGLTTTTSWF